MLLPKRRPDYSARCMRRRFNNCGLPKGHSIWQTWCTCTNPFQAFDDASSPPFVPYNLTTVSLHPFGEFYPAHRTQSLWRLCAAQLKKLKLASVSKGILVAHSSWHESCSLSLSHTHTRTHTLSFTHTHTHTAPLYVSLSLSHTHTHAYTHTHSLSLHTHTRTHCATVRPQAANFKCVENGPNRGANPTVIVRRFGGNLCVCDCPIGASLQPDGTCKLDPSIQKCYDDKGQVSRQAAHSLLVDSLELTRVHTPSTQHCHRH